MANPDPTLSAAELRRRLLKTSPPAQTPPAAAAQADTEGTIDMDVMPTQQQPSGGISWNGGSGGNVLSRLRLPGQSVPAAPPPEGPFAPPPAASINKRTPITGLRLPPAVEAGSPGYMPGPGSVNFGIPEQPPSGSRSSRMQLPPGSGPQRGPTSRSPEEWQGEAQRLKSENKELRQLLGEMKQLLQEASENEQQAAARHQEIQASLAEKEREIADLNAQMQAIEEQLASGALSAPAPQPAAQPKTRGELEEWADELEQENARLVQERKRLDSDRQQLRDDEESLEKQMRDMEVSMARERALMSRQEMELKRLSAEIQHDLEMMQRGDASLREQMSKFQRRAQDVMQGKIDPRSASQSSMNLGGLPPRR